MQDRNDHSPAGDFRWSGPNTDIRNKPTPEQCDEARRTAKAHNAGLTGVVETATAKTLHEYALGPNPSEAAKIAHDLGLANQAESYAFIRRVLFLEHTVKLLAERVAQLEKSKA